MQNHRAPPEFVDDAVYVRLRRLAMPAAVATVAPMLTSLLARLRAHPSRTGSLVVTFFGDMAHTGAVPLGTLLDVFAGLDIADGVVRTAISRLSADGWLERKRQGRNSFYRLAPRGCDATRAAEARIYGSGPAPWSGRFRLAIVEPGGEREAARLALAAEGFGAALPGLMVAVGGAPMPAPPGVLLLEASADAGAARALAARAWPLDDLAERYRLFLDTVPERADPLDEFDSVLARLLLVHEWRRVVLRDPRLPAELLPADWPGHAARAAFARLYPPLATGSASWLAARGVAVDSGRVVLPI